MRNLLLKLAEWIYRHYQIKVLAIPLGLPDARALVAAHEGPQSGEYKRHQVLAKLMKAGASERDSALAIELAVRGL
jgi:hypothetical protein